MESTIKSYIELKTGKDIYFRPDGIVFNLEESESLDELEIITAKCFIVSCCKRLKQKNTEIGSYGFKHKAESWGRSMNEILNKQVFSSYVSNGSFIYAAISLGFSIIVSNYTTGKSYNCYFNLSYKSFMNKCDATY